MRLTPRRAAALAGGAALLAIALGLVAMRATIDTNLGAVSQTEAELSIYDGSAWPIQDAIRRSLTGRLAPAMHYYQAALRSSPGNVTANRRLGQIELSLGNYDAARRYLETAYALAPSERATRQLLGESYAIAGETGRAAALWETVDLSEGQLDIRQWWYQYLGEPQAAAAIAAAASAATLATRPN